MKDKIITDINDLDLSKTYTYADYLSWRFTERVELIMGKIFKMTPAPSRLHQEILGKIFLAIGNILSGSSCDIYPAPFDVRLPQKYGGEDTVVQPDICIVCDTSKLDEKGCDGAPDLIIEILSPSTASKDLKEKYLIYEAAGVLEYWTVDTIDGLINVYVLNKNGKYQAYKPYTVHEKVVSRTIPGLEIELNEIFPNLLEEPYVPYEGKRI